MDPPFSGFLFGQSKCQNLTIYEKREIVWQLARWPEVAPEKLQSWRRSDLLEILCAETGRERKHTGLPKQKLIENLFKILLEKKAGKHQSQIKSRTPTKRRRKDMQLSDLPASADDVRISDENEAPMSTTIVCENVACRAALSTKDRFCKRCSCCICYNYDDDKDPSLWLFCSTENLDGSGSCGRSCHVECALKDERTGIGSKGKCLQLDWSYYCVHCGRANDLLGCSKKQVTIAKEARRVDVLCHRISLSHKLVSTQKRQDLHEILDEVIKKLEAEAGPLNGLSSMGRAIVSRLSVGDEIRRLCARAIGLLDSLPSSSSSANLQLQSETRNLGMSELGATTDPKIPLTKEMSPKTNSSDFPHNSGLLADLNKPPGSYFSHDKEAVVVESEKSFEQMDQEEMPSLSGSASDEEPSPMPINSIDPNLSLENEDESVPLVENKNFEIFALNKSCEQMEKTPPRLLESTLNMESNSTSNPKTLTEKNQPPEKNNGYISDSSGLCADLNKPSGSYFTYEENLDFKVTNEISVPMDNGKSNSTPPGLAKSIETNQPLENVYEFDPSTSNEEPEVVDSNRSCEQVEQGETPRLSRTTSDTEPNSTPYLDSDRIQPLQIRLEPPERNERVNVPSLPAKSGITSLLEDAPPQNKLEREPGSSWEKREVKSEEDYEYCVKVIRWLECRGHMESSFRVKFLTWLSLRATPQERRVVSVFIDTLVDDPGSLAGQLVDSFSDAICSKKPITGLNNSFFMRLQH
ncbi:Protein vernalization insensitive 3 [Apostasia shenzhenica]|uniref:Protein vernalization insensitive 3 n=1 Tax=Apostasia shenzhenica TaxID=1088818 RepID=A0A2I0BCB8_9ASPA|nr:Protein vernalization insensitive 3 [Apostasia shenzhenica]